MPNQQPACLRHRLCLLIDLVSKIYGFGSPLLSLWTLCIPTATHLERCQHDELCQPCQAAQRCHTFIGTWRDTACRTAPGGAAPPEAGRVTPDSGMPECMRMQGARMHAAGECLQSFKALKEGRCCLVECCAVWPRSLGSRGTRSVALTETEPLSECREIRFLGDSPVDVTRRNRLCFLLTFRTGKHTARTGESQEKAQWASKIDRHSL